jgi:hypothetical protein
VDDLRRRHSGGDELSDEPIKDAKTGRFVPGGGSRGRHKGARNRLHAHFVRALQEHWEEEGHKAIKIAFREDPIGYMRTIVSILPKEYILEDGRLETMSDIELEEHLDELRALKARTIGSNTAGGAQAPEDRKQVEILPPVQKAKGFPRQRRNKP